MNLNYKSVLLTSMPGEILAIIPARGGSKAIPNKNITPLNGTPLLHYTYQALARASYVSRAVLSSDCDAILKTCGSFPFVEPLRRPARLSLDDTPTVPVLLHVLNHLYEVESYIPDYILVLQPTSPLRNSKHIDDACKIALDNTAVDSVISVTRLKHNFNPESLMILQNSDLQFSHLHKESFSRHEKQQYYARNGAIYLTKFSVLSETLSLFGQRIKPYVMSPLYSVDIDDHTDLVFASLLLQHLNQ